MSQIDLNTAEGIKVAMQKHLTEKQIENFTQMLEAIAMFVYDKFIPRAVALQEIGIVPVTDSEIDDILQSQSIESLIKPETKKPLKRKKPPFKPKARISKVKPKLRRP